jgi:hypothetical protein
MSDLDKGKAIVDAVLSGIPEAAELNAEQKERLENAVLVMTTSLALYPTLPEDSPERYDLETKMSYAKLTITSLAALSYVKVEAVIKEAVQDLFMLGVRTALVSLV